MKLLLRFSLLTALIIVGRINKKEPAMFSQKVHAKVEVQAKERNSPNFVVGNRPNFQPAAFRTTAKDEPAAQLN